MACVCVFLFFFSFSFLALKVFCVISFSFSISELHCEHQGDGGVSFLSSTYITLAEHVRDQTDFRLNVKSDMWSVQADMFLSH